MNSRSQRACHRNSHRLCAAILLLAAAVFAPQAGAQGKWKIDPVRSVAILSLGSETNALQTGLARVSGEVHFDVNNPGHTFVTFRIFPEDSSAAQSVTMTFSPTQSAMAADDKLMLTGDLSVTQVEHNITAEPNEAYAGPRYGSAVSHTVTRQITMVLPDPTHQKREISLTGTILRTNFPEFLEVVSDNPWPAQLINDVRCDNPSTIGEDYHGPACTGTVIATLENAVLPTGGSGGEGFFGFEPASAPDRDRATITLHLVLTDR